MKDIKEELKKEVGTKLRAHNFETDNFDIAGYISSVDLDKEEMTVRWIRVTRK